MFSISISGKLIFWPRDGHSGSTIGYSKSTINYSISRIGYSRIDYYLFIIKIVKVEPPRTSRI